MPVAMRIHEEFSVPHEIPKYDRQIREALKKFDWDASGGLRFQELAKVFKQPGTETGTGTPMTPEQIKGFLRKFDTNRDGVLDFGEFMNGWRMTFGVDADHILLQALRSAPYKKPFSLTTHYAASESAIASKITAMKDPMGTSEGL